MTTEKTAQILEPTTMLSGFM